MREQIVPRPITLKFFLNKKKTVFTLTRRRGQVKLDSDKSKVDVEKLKLKI